MARVKRGTTAHARHKKITDKAKGYYGRRKNVFRVAVQAVEKAGQYAYRDRKVRKRTFRGALDSTYQCWCQGTWTDIFTIYEWPEKSGYRA